MPFVSQMVAAGKILRVFAKPRQAEGRGKNQDPVQIGTGLCVCVFLFLCIFVFVPVLFTCLIFLLSAFSDNLFKEFPKKVQLKKGIVVHNNIIMYIVCVHML